MEEMVPEAQHLLGTRCGEFPEVLQGVKWKTKSLDKLGEYPRVITKILLIKSVEDDFLKVFNFKLFIYTYRKVPEIMQKISIHLSPASPLSASYLFTAQSLNPQNSH